MRFYLVKDSRFSQKSSPSSPDCLEFMGHLDQRNFYKVQPISLANGFENKQLRAVDAFIARVVREPCRGLGHIWFCPKPGGILIHVKAPGLSSDQASPSKLTTENPGTRDISIRGVFLAELCKKLGNNNDGGGELDIKLTLTYYHQRNLKKQVTTTKLFEAVAEGFVMTDYEKRVYSTTGVLWKLPPVWFSKYSTESFWTVTLECAADKFLFFDGFSPTARIRSPNRMILLEGHECDFNLEAEDGSIFPCHKHFLSAGSPVFSAMLSEPKYMEATESKMKMTDVSGAGVKALLKYLYYKGVEDPLTSCRVTLELLRAADMFDIPELWQNMLTILMVKPAHWFDLEATLNMINYVQLKDARLFRRLVQMLCMNEHLLKINVIQP